MNSSCQVYEDTQKGVCPFCKSPDIEGQEVTIEDGAAYQKCSCLECEKGWEDRYVLTTYLELT